MNVERKAISLSDKRFDSISQDIRKSYKNSCILWIEEIKNPELEKLYQKQKTEIEQKRKKSCEELQLYHGTNEVSADIIIKEGFNPELNKRAVYGRGSYFAKNALYSCRDFCTPSHDDVSFVLLCSVLVGEIGTYGVMQPIDTKKHDNSVDYPANPTIYATPYQYGAIPRYLVAFHKNAK